MIEYYKTDATGATQRITAPERGCWVNVVQPTERERAWLQSEAGILPEFLSAALDEEESSHVDYDDDANQVLVIVDCPSVEDESEREAPGLTQYDTQPLSVLFLRDRGMLVTISLHESVIVNDFTSNSKGKVRQVDTTRRARFLLQLLLRISQQYLVYLRSIDRQFSKTEKQLHATMRNEELVKMLGLEKSLVYFSISLKADETTLKRIMGGRIIKLYEEDQDLLDDVLIEIHQAIEMCTIYSDILTKTMDAFSSVISNNLNNVMRVLTTITIVMAIPTIIFSFYGMNVGDLPEDATWIFPTLVSLSLCVIAVVFFWRKNMFR